MTPLDRVDVRPGVLRNRAGVRIVTLTTTPRGRHPPHALVVVVPGYGGRIEDHPIVAWTLALNGFAALRFDFTNHVGLSDGDVADLTMTAMEHDVAAVLAGARRAAAGRPVLVAAISLGARAAIRWASRRAGADGLLLLTPAVDVERTIARAAGFDPVAQWRSGAVTDPDRTHRVVAHEVRYGLARDVVERGWGGVAAAREEVSRIEAPVLALAGENDDWVHPHEVRSALSAPAPFRRELTVLAGGSHDVTRDPSLLHVTTETALAYLREMAGAPPQPTVLPGFSEIVEIVAEEQRWADGAFAELLEPDGARRAA